MKYTITSCLMLLCFIGYGQRLQTPTLSPISKVSQQVGLTSISLEYSRPSAKGRVVFGDLVPYDEIWRTGANASTKIILEEAAHIGGNAIDKGTYALYTIPNKEQWTIIIHSKTDMRSLAGDVYKKENDVFRFTVPVQRTEDYTETFTIQFNDIKADNLHLDLMWENTKISIPIAVEVSSKIDQQMKAFLLAPEKIPHRTYFSAAQYYLTNDRDLKTAVNWIDAALKKSPKNFRYGLLKAKILHKSGDSNAAMNTINEAHEWAQEAGNANYIMQTVVFKKFLEQ